MPLPSLSLGALITAIESTTAHHVGRAGHSNAVPAVTVTEDTFLETWLALCDVVGISPFDAYGKLLAQEGAVALPEGYRYGYAYIETCRCDSTPEARSGVRYTAA